ncbi:MAG TPA: RICIN domain-containing protein, partial [Prolixibacteraceae bacterium]|nr:RICIN domain-containing protein [Prolixibacteraceae bacterium]
YIIKNNGYYYLFLNRASCCNGISSTYYIEVSRSTLISGPYNDTRLFLHNQSGNIIGPGHVGYANEVLSYHYYDGFSNGYPRLMTTTMHFENGWPVAGNNGVELSKVNGTYALVAMHSNKAIGMKDAVAEDGTNIAQWEYTGNDSQKLIITNEEDQWHSIKPAINTTKAFDVYEISEDDGANINLWDYWGGEGQQFCFQKAGGNEYRLINRNSNRCIDIENASQSNGANVIQWGCIANAPQQTFRLVDLSETGFERQTDTEGINIFPNPSNGTFSISTKIENATVKIVNMQGVTVFVDVLKGRAGQISTNLTNGIYMLFINDKYHLAQKIIIK